MSKSVIKTTEFLINNRGNLKQEEIRGNPKWRRNENLQRVGIFGKELNIFLNYTNITVITKNIFIEIKSLMDRLDLVEERNSELENKAGEIIQNAAKEAKIWKI